MPLPEPVAATAGSARPPDGTPAPADRTASDVRTDHVALRPARHSDNPPTWTFHGGMAVIARPPETPADGPIVVLDEPDAVQALQDAPAPRPRTDRVVEATFPDDVPVAGAVPFNVAAVEDGAVALLAGLQDLGPDVAAGWDSPERWAWLTAAVLVVGGAGYAVRGHFGRPRTGGVGSGSDSALARWEERHAGRTV